MKEKTIKAAIEEFNKYRKPEACAELNKIDKELFELTFTGSFCYSCGFYDYFDDFLIILEEKGLNANIKDVKRINGGAIVTFYSKSNLEK